MKILAVADEESRFYYDYYSPGKLDEFDLILSCGDLKREYLEFLVTMAHCPVLYVHGNHDGAYDADPPQGCVSVEDRLFVYRGVRILGLGGSYRYREGTHMYTEGQMARRIWRLKPQLWRAGGFDILLTHAPARHIHDLDTTAHQGFQCFVDLINQYQPRYFVHGHVHRNYGRDIPQRSAYQNTEVINASGHCIFEL